MKKISSFSIYPWCILCELTYEWNITNRDKFYQLHCGNQNSCTPYKHSPWISIDGYTGTNYSKFLMMMTHANLTLFLQSMQTISFLFSKVFTSINESCIEKVQKVDIPFIGNYFFWKMTSMFLIFPKNLTSGENRSL